VVGCYEYSTEFPDRLNDLPCQEGIFAMELQVVSLNLMLSDKFNFGLHDFSINLLYMKLKLTSVIIFKKLPIIQKIYTVPEV